MTPISPLRLAADKSTLRSQVRRFDSLELAIRDNVSKAQLRPLHAQSAATHVRHVRINDVFHVIRYTVEDSRPYQCGVYKP